MDDYLPTDKRQNSLPQDMHCRILGLIGRNIGVPMRVRIVQQITVSGLFSNSPFLNSIAFLRNYQ